MLVKATKRGFDGVKLREPGDTFEFEGKPGSWMEPVKEEAAANTPAETQKETPAKQGNRKK